MKSKTEDTEKTTSLDEEVNVDRTLTNIQSKFRIMCRRTFILNVRGYLKREKGEWKKKTCIK